jgi:hypothetical protein
MEQSVECLRRKLEIEKGCYLDKKEWYIIEAAVKGI